MKAEHTYYMLTGQAVAEAERVPIDTRAPRRVPNRTNPIGVFYSVDHCNRRPNAPVLWFSDTLFAFDSESQEIKIIMS